MEFSKLWPSLRLVVFVAAAICLVLFVLPEFTMFAVSLSLVAVGILLCVWIDKRFVPEFDTFTEIAAGNVAAGHYWRGLCTLVGICTAASVFATGRSLDTEGYAYSGSDITHSASVRGVAGEDGESRYLDRPLEPIGGGSARESVLRGIRFVGIDGSPCCGAPSANGLESSVCKSAHIPSYERHTLGINPRGLRGRDPMETPWWRPHWIYHPLAEGSRIHR